MVPLPVQKGENDQQLHRPDTIGETRWKEDRVVSITEFDIRSFSIRRHRHSMAALPIKVLLDRRYKSSRLYPARFRQPP